MPGGVGNGATRALATSRRHHDDCDGDGRDLSSLHSSHPFFETETRML
jgi:hypothetical protein